MKCQEPSDKMMLAVYGSFAAESWTLFTHLTRDSPRISGDGKVRQHGHSSRRGGHQWDLVGASCLESKTGCQISEYKWRWNVREGSNQASDVAAPGAGSACHSRYAACVHPKQGC